MQASSITHCTIKEISLTRQKSFLSFVQNSRWPDWTLDGEQIENDVAYHNVSSRANSCFRCLILRGGGHLRSRLEESVPNFPAAKGFARGIETAVFLRRNTRNTSHFSRQLWHVRPACNVLIASSSLSQCNSVRQTPPTGAFWPISRDFLAVRYLKIRRVALVVDYSTRSQRYETLDPVSNSSHQISDTSFFG